MMCSDSERQSQGPVEGGGVHISCSTTERQRAEFFEHGVISPEIRGELLESWQRTKALGVPNGSVVPPCVPVDTINPEMGRLLNGPLEYYSDSLADTGLALVVADRNGTVVSRWCSHPRIQAALDSVHSVPGAVLSEATVGTNALGTPLVTHRPIEISRAEHVTDLFRSITCAGAPVRDPFTGTILGSIALAGYATEASASLLPTLTDLLARLSQTVFSRPPNGFQPSVRPPQSSSSPGWLHLLERTDRIRRSGGICLLTGEPGTGKKTAAIGREAGPVACFDARLEKVQGHQAWMRAVQQSLGQTGTLVIRHVYALNQPGLQTLKALLDLRHPRAVVFLTADDNETRRVDFGAIQLRVPPLRERPTDLLMMLENAAQDRGQHPMILDAAAKNLLLHYPWPGNLTEFSGMMDELLLGGATKVGLADLPTTVRQHHRRLGLLEQSERAAIERAVKAAGGNMTEAAKVLGISRATLYRKVQIQDRSVPAAR